MTKRQLKAAVGRARAGRARARFSSELKSALREYALERRGEGATWGQVGDEIGLSENHISRLCRGGRLREVTVVPDVVPSSGLTLTLPGGAEVSGLDVASLSALLKALR